MSGSGNDSPTLAPVQGLIDALDPLLEHRIRLATCSMLSGVDAISFNGFKQAMPVTDGNLGAQLKKLEQAGYIAVDKRDSQGRKLSWYRLTELGATALDKHLRALHQLINLQASAE